MPALSHMLWFNDQAEEAVNLYTNLFDNSKILNTSHRPDGSVFTIEFELLGSKYTALNGGDMFKFTEAFSIFILCNDQAEVDKYWDALTVDGGTSGRCGWLKDRFGLSWQIIPKQLGECLANSDPVKSAAAMKAMMGMSKIIVSELEAAVNQR
jgi:predicted 3-demethylubiquinone-9 3-methyltransferase (glyoxalase superfamily)